MRSVAIFITKLFLTGVARLLSRYSFFHINTSIIKPMCLWRMHGLFFYLERGKLMKKGMIMNKGGISTQVLLYFLIMMFLMVISCGGGGGGDAAPPTAAFTQADLTGTWNFTVFQTGSNPGWDRGTLTINGSGDVHFATYEATDGRAAAPDGAVKLTIDSSGVVTESGTGKADESHCSLSADKNTFVCVVTNGTEYSTRIGVKTTGVTFSNADLTGPLSWNLHGITSGGSSASDREWEYDAGTINSSRQVTVTEYQKPDGAQPLPTANSSMFSVGADGFVTMQHNGTPVANWKGMLSSDKKMMVVTYRDGGSPEIYGFGIFTIADQTFSGVADLAGNWKIFNLYGGNNFGWQWILATFDTSGVGSSTSFLDSLGNTTNGHQGYSLSTGGILTSTGSFIHGVLSHDRIVNINTDSDTGYELMIWIR